jgi:adenine-specific DNA methylase
VHAGHVENGRAVCPACSHREALIKVADRTGGPPQFRVFAVETLPSSPERRWANVERRIRTVTPGDQRGLKAAARCLRKEMAADPGFLAAGPIPREGRSDNRLVQYGYRSYSELHTVRQKLHLGLLARAIERIEGEAGEALRIAFSDHLVTNNVLCAYSGGWRRLSPLFSIRAFRHIVRPVEINPWLERNGRGTFPNAVRAVERAARSLKESLEPTIEGAVRRVPWREPGSWDIRCHDARDLVHIRAGSIDLVLTDPPYFNYIAYSELGHFFVPWLVRFGLVGKEHLTHFPSGQLSQGGAGADAGRAFGGRLAEALHEIVRVCRPKARIVFTYQNLDGHGWSGLASALAATGIRPVRAWPMFGDSGAGLHKKSNSISWDCVILCEIAGTPLSFDGLGVARDAGEAFADRWAERLSEDGHNLTVGDRANLAFAGAMVALFDASRGNALGASLRTTPEMCHAALPV